MADPVLEAALATQAPIVFGAIRIDMDGIGGRTGPLCLLDGSGEVTINSELYVGRDATFGTIDSISVINEAEGEEAPEISLTLLPASGAAATALASPLMQGRQVSIMLGALNPATGAPIGQPEVIFLGEIDVPTLRAKEGEHAVEYTITSVFERLFEVEDGARAQDGWHQSFHPGELGFNFMSGTNKNLYWGAKPPPRAYTGGAIGLPGLGGLYPGLIGFY